ncbi:MAG: hypothetical protein EU544_01555, partial [Promethearchaeota archaeon]
MAKKNTKNKKKEKTVLTVRIKKDLDESLNKVKNELGLSKADLIRNYLNLCNYMHVQKKAIKTPDNRNLMIFKREILVNFLSGLDEINQAKFGEELGRFINDIARLKGKVDDLEYKLEMCESLGFFPILIDAENYILVPHDFGPLKFVEAFMWRMIMQEDFVYIDGEMDKNQRKRYEKEIEM